MTPEQRAKHDRDVIENFDREFPVGTVVWFWTTLPMGPVKETKIRGGVLIADSGQPVCFVKGVAGYVSIYHIFPVDEARRPYLTFAP